MIHTTVNRTLHVHVEADVHANGCSVHFTAYAIPAYTTEGSRPMFAYGDGRVNDFTEHLPEAAVMCHGDVRWDGTSQWKFPDPCGIYGESRSDLTRVGAILAFCWDWAAELLTKKGPL